MIQTKREVLHQRQLEEYKKRVPRLQNREPTRREPVRYVSYSKGYDGNVVSDIRKRWPWLDINFLNEPLPPAFVLLGSDEDKTARAAAEALPTPPLPYELTPEYLERRRCDRAEWEVRRAKIERLEAGLSAEEQIPALANDADIPVDDEPDALARLSSDVEIGEPEKADPEMVAFIKEEAEREAERKRQADRLQSVPIIDNQSMNNSLKIRPARQRNGLRLGINRR